MVSLVGSVTPGVTGHKHEAPVIVLINGCEQQKY